MIPIRAHFDGKVFVPEEPVDCPPNTPLRLHIEPEPVHPLAGLASVAEGLPEDTSWPEDGATEHDHYLYGSPRNTQ